MERPSRFLIEALLNQYAPVRLGVETDRLTTGDPQVSRSWSSREHG